MNKIYRLTVMSALIFSSAIGATAQTALRSGYFNENYLMRHELNPAINPQRNYVAILPALSGTNIAMRSNIGVDNILFPMADGKLTTFMNSSVPSSFLDDLSTNNNIGTDINLNIISFGFRGFGGFNTIGLSLRSSIYMNLPKGLFEFMKLGQVGTSSTYSFDDLGMEADAYAELAIGHQHKINSHWAVGGKLKFLIGLAHADMSVGRMTMEMSDDKWVVNADGEMNLAVKGLKLPTHTEAGTTKSGRPLYNQSFDFNKLELDSKSIGTNGFGVAVDLGVTYKAHFLDGLELSASVLNLGFINYSSNIKGLMNNNEPWEFGGFTICSNENGTGHEGHMTFEDQAENLGNEIADYLTFKKEEGNSRSRILAATVNVGASYALPMYKRLKFGFLSSTRINGAYSWSEGRLSANVNPCGGLDIGVNYAVSSFGSSFGWLVNFACTGFNIYLGMDHTLTKVTKQYIPMSGNANVSFGICFPLGKKHS